MTLSRKENVLVTGGSGFLGLEICKLLIKSNYNVISFSRNHSPKLQELNITQIHGNLAEIADIKRALQNIDAVIHTASKVGMSGKLEDFLNSNFLGTKNLVDVMKEMEIKKLIYTSTPSVVFERDDIYYGDESIPYAKHFLTHYAYSKKLAEQYVLSSCDSFFWAISLRPHLIFGIGDLNLIPRILESRLKNKLKIVGDGKNLVDVIPVKNAALAHLMALQKLDSNLSGNKYFIGQGPVNLWSFINEVLLHKGLNPIKTKVPMPVAYGIGFIIELALKLLRKNDLHPPMSRFIALQLGKSHYFNHNKSLQDLGNYQVHTLVDTIKSL